MDTSSAAEQAYHRGKLLAWNPRQIDLARDAADWAGLAPPEHVALLGFTRLFEAVQATALRHLPALAIALDRRGHPVADLQCLAAQVWETARHVEWHARWLAEVGRPAVPAAFADDDHFRALVAEDLPACLDLVLVDHGDLAVARAVATYHLVCAAALLEPAMGEVARALRVHDVLPGLTYGLDLARRDLVGHADVGADLLARVLGTPGSASGANPPTVAGKAPPPGVGALTDGPGAPIDLRRVLAPPLQLAAGTLAAVFHPWGAVAPLGVDLDRVADAARAGLAARLGRIGLATTGSGEAAGAGTSGSGSEANSGAGSTDPAA